MPHLFSSIGSIKLDPLRAQRKLGRHRSSAKCADSDVQHSAGRRAVLGGRASESLLRRPSTDLAVPRGSWPSPMAEQLRPSDKVDELPGGQFQPKLVWERKPLWLGLHASREAAEAAYDVAKLLVRA